MYRLCPDNQAQPVLLYHMLVAEEYCCVNNMTSPRERAAIPLKQGPTAGAGLDKQAQ